MAEAVAPPAAAAAAAAAGPAPAGGKKIGLLIGLALGGAVLGGGLGAFVVAPRIIASRHPAGTDSTAAGAEAGQGGPGGEAEIKEQKLTQLENIIVNPAGSQGTRFLMTSVAFAVSDDKAVKVLEDHKIELRDRVTTILESQTMAQLTAPGARDSIKILIAESAGELLGPRSAVKVFLPQFVIQ
jgi:flagellar protein FliL